MLELFPTLAVPVSCLKKISFDFSHLKCFAITCNIANSKIAKHNQFMIGHVLYMLLGISTHVMILLQLSLCNLSAQYETSVRNSHIPLCKLFHAIYTKIFSAVKIEKFR